jgi:hypothetical protein
MGLETATFISQLVETNPIGSVDEVLEGDDHIRLVKSVLKIQFPSLGEAAVNATAAQINLLASLSALSILGRSSNSTGPAAAIVASAANQVLQRVGTTLAFALIGTDNLNNDAVTNAKLANMAQARIKGRAVGAGTGDPVDLTEAQVLAIVNAAGAVANALLLEGENAAYYRNATNLNAGTVNIARFPGVALRNVTSGQTSGSVTVSTSGPSGGANGDIWLEREA